MRIFAAINLKDYEKTTILNGRFVPDGNNERTGTREEILCLCHFLIPFTMKVTMTTSICLMAETSGRL